MTTGSIKSIISDKGYLFIRADHGGDYFAHHSALLDAAIEELPLAYPPSAE